MDCQSLTQNFKALGVVSHSHASAYLEHSYLYTSTPLARLKFTEQSIRYRQSVWTSKVLDRFVHLQTTSSYISTYNTIHEP